MNTIEVLHCVTLFYHHSHLSQLSFSKLQLNSKIWQIGTAKVKKRQNAWTLIGHTS